MSVGVKFLWRFFYVLGTIKVAIIQRKHAFRKKSMSEFIRSSIYCSDFFPTIFHRPARSPQTHQREWQRPTSLMWLKHNNVVPMSWYLKNDHKQITVQWLLCFCSWSKCRNDKKQQRRFSGCYEPAGLVIMVSFSPRRRGLWRQMDFFPQFPRTICGWLWNRVLVIGLFCFCEDQSSSGSVNR